MIVLGIETSCDETACAIVADGDKIMANIVASQIDIHSAYGGIIPEIASRKHVESIYAVIKQALTVANIGIEDLDGIAVTQFPGLVGSLLVGIAAAKSFAFARQLPLVGVNHLFGHIAAIFLTEKKPAFPFVALVVSGGHTSTYVVHGPHNFALAGQTLDDAAGEAFDKAAKLLNLGYPGGVAIDKLAKKGKRDYIAFPRAMRNSTNFSFSGVKTALLNYLQKISTPPNEEALADIVSSYQEAIVEVLVEKTISLALSKKIPRVVVCGGVAANSRLRAAFQEAGDKEQIAIFIPPIALCTDNAAMIAAAGFFRLQNNERDDLAINAISRIHANS
ncbi:MAG: tRNA (adenosine(37)-N6)-threonylcarbamoyltransferase complex transferase subunit TsaD [Deltaproteobacteria bacterium]|nr:tRNA (adenosine(37)-N6)-threonylcarbamoyltransferase complex transferase subunit TsaD [Deltaproteobacteria bacterium]